jgi:hypothetical protein
MTPEQAREIGWDFARTVAAIDKLLLSSESVETAAALILSADHQARMETARACAEMCDEAAPTFVPAGHIDVATALRDRIAKAYGLGPVRSGVGRVLDGIIFPSVGEARK